jgi:flotillin
MENEAAGIKAKGEAEAAAIQAKAVAEAEGILKKAEAMKQYGEAAMADMQMEAIKLYFEQLPAIAEAVGKGYQNVDKIYMYGGDTSKLTGDIMTNVTQINEGLSESMGFDLKTLLTGFLGGRLGASDSKEVTVNVEQI